MIIEEFKTDRAWKYFWGKYVKGVDLSVHCARCLLGEYESAFNAGTKHLQDLQLKKKSKVFYMCGVSSPFVWEQNFHLAVIESAGDVVDIERNGVMVRIRDAKELPINFDFDKCQYRMKHNKSFGTCRNWQFATIYGNLFSTERGDSE